MEISHLLYICLNVPFWMRLNINLKDFHIRIGEIIHNVYILYTNSQICVKMRNRRHDKYSITREQMRL